MRHPLLQERLGRSTWRNGTRRPKEERATFRAVPKGLRDSGYDYMWIRSYLQEKRRCRNLLRCFRGLDRLTTKQPIHAVGDSPREAYFHRSNQDSEREAVKLFTKTELGGTGCDGRINGAGDCRDQLGNTGLDNEHYEDNSKARDLCKLSSLRSDQQNRKVI